MNVAKRCGVPVPQSFGINALSELRAGLDSLRFPLVAKPSSKDSKLPFKVRYYHDRPQLEDEFLKDPAFGRQCLFQEYAPGDGVGIELLMSSGKPRMLFQHRRLLEHPSTGGVSVVAIAEELSPELVRSSLALLREIGWEGPAMVEYRYDRVSGRLTLMEVNGRFWGSLGLSIAAGADFPFAAWEQAHGHQVSPSKYRVGTRARWTTGVLLRLHELFGNPRSDGVARPSAWRELLSAPKLFLPGIRDMVWTWDDPYPAASELILAATRLLRQTVKLLIGRALPKPILTSLRTWRSLEPGTNQLYARRQLRRIAWHSRPKLPVHVKSVLCVCHGNIIRSPFAAELFARAQLRAKSAGLHAKAGRRADERAIRIASDFGINLSEHVAEPLNNTMIDEADVVFVMDAVNEARFLHRYPQARGKLLLLGIFSPSRLSGDEIPDPYEKGDQEIRGCYEIIVNCVAQVCSQAGTLPDSRGATECH
jgi:protein-tyrosine-phosphatase